MNRTTKRMYWGLVAVVGTAALGLGCGNPLATIAWLRDDGKIPAQYKLEPKDGRKEVTVAVLVSAAPEVGTSRQFATLDRDLAIAIGNALTEDTAKEKVRFRVIEPARVAKLQSVAPEKFALAERGEVAEKLGADYLIQVNVTSFGLYGSGFGRELPQGHAAVDVTVFEAGAGGVKKYDYPHVWEDERLAASSNVPASGYYQTCVKKLGKEIAQQHVTHNRENGGGLTKGR